MQTVVTVIHLPLLLILNVVIMHCLWKAYCLLQPELWFNAHPNLACFIIEYRQHQELNYSENPDTLLPLVKILSAHQQMIATIYIMAIPS